MIIVIFQLQFARTIRKEEFTNPISEDIVCGLDIERLFNLGIWSANEMEEDQSRDQCRDDYVYTEVSLFSILEEDAGEGWDTPTSCLMLCIDKIEERAS